MNSLRSVVWKVLIWPCVALIGSLATAADSFPDPLPELKTYELTVSPVGESSPALKYLLFPELDQTVPGNAATHYFRAIIHSVGQPKPTPEESQIEADWNDIRSSKLPLEDVKKWLAMRHFVLLELDAATRCESCDWGIRFQDLRGRDVVENRLNEFQEMRQLARVLKLKAQVEIAEKRYDDAIATLRQLYRIARDINTAPSVIVSLISAAVVAITNETTIELISAENSPNLYWPLRMLPDPIIERHAVTRLDVNTVFQLFPFLRDADTTHRTPEEWQRLLTESVAYLRMLTSSSPGNEKVKTVHQISATMLALRSYPIAKQALVAAGMDEARVEKMPVGQVVAIYARNCFQVVADEYLKWSSVPYHEGEARLQGLFDELLERGYIARPGQPAGDRDPLGFNSGLLPSYLTGEAYIRQRRMIALMSTVEAIRLHAATHQGKLPEHLADVKLVPIPVDPATNKPFLYRVIDGRADLIALPSRTGDGYSGRRFQIRIR